MARTGYLIVIYQDINPSSPTYNQTREERTQSEEFCPSSAAAQWIVYTKYCELTENGMLTGYEITVYRDVEPLSSTYNQIREERELNLTECEADETTANWQNIGEPFCRQTVYMPGGLMGNDGYMVQQQQDMNEYSPTADQIRENATLDLTNCPLPNTLPEWEVIYEACHIIKQDGQLMFDGTKDVVRIDRNQYSPSWNDNVPETVNVEDLVNCPPDIDVQYRWVGVSGEYMCVGYDKYSVEKKQRSTDGQTWTDVVPLQTRAGSLIEANSEDCGYTPTIEYRWVVVSGEYVCVGFDKHAMEKKQQRIDGGSWTDVTPTETRAGELIEENSEYCGYEPTIEYRWVVVSGEYVCVGFDKHATEKKQQSTDGGTTWTDVVPTETRTGSLIEANSVDCGYEPTTDYRWVVITGQYECVGFDKYSVEKRQQSTDDGTTWTDVVPLQTRTGELIEENSEDCGYEPTIEYRWVVVSGEYVCVGFDKHATEKKQQSTDGGTTWTDVVPTETRTGSLIEANSEYCGYVPETIYRWITISGQYECVGFDKYSVEKRQQSTNSGETWTDVVPLQTRAGTLVEANSEYCGYTDYTSFDCGIIFTDLNTNDHYFSTNNSARFELLSTQVNNTNGYIRVNFRIHIKKNMGNYDWIVRADGGTMAAQRYIGNVVNGQVITDYFEVPCGNYNFMLNIQESISDTILMYAQSHLTYICNDCSQTPVYTTRWVEDTVDYLCNGVDKYALEREQCYQDGEWWYTSKEREGVLIKSNSLDCGGTGNVYETQYLRTTALEDGTITFFVPDLFDTYYVGNVYYSLDNGETWTTNAEGTTDKLTTVNVTTGQSVLWKCVADRMGIADDSRNCNFRGTASFNVDGNIMSMLRGDNFVGSTTTNTYVFAKLFRESKVVDASNLVLADSGLTEYCYYEMFRGCTNLVNTPTLPARVLASGCYNGMFRGCTSLVNAPLLNAITLASSCYGDMFEDCTSLLTAPVLPATTLATECYEGMFHGCTSLTTPPELPATTLKGGCYNSMFFGCTSLTTAPELPATTLVYACYYSMFYNCTSLNYIKCMATDISATVCTGNWVLNVAASGTFVKASSMNDWTTGNNGIPSGWVVEPKNRWVVITGTFVCVGYDKHEQEKQQVSYDNGQTWTDVVPLQTRTGSLIEANSVDCGYVPETIYRWITISGQYECVGFDKYSVEKKQQSTDDGTTWTDVVPTETRAGELIEENSEYCGYEPTPVDYSTQYLTFVTLESGTFKFTRQVSYSLDDGSTWTTLAANTNTPTIAINNKILWKANINPSSSGHGRFSSTGRFNVEGNLLSLHYGDNFIGQTDISSWSYGFYRLFADCTQLISAENLSLPATSLCVGAYYSLFSGCTSLTTPPTLLPSTTLAKQCYREMFLGCTSLVDASNLVLPATTLATECYEGMFQLCTSLVNAPELPATTLASKCYYFMFVGCTSLTTAPELPATTLANNCYEYMFNSCSNLNYIKAMFTTTPGSNYTAYWVERVAANGTFVKNSNASWNARGSSSVPSGWTIINEN